MLILIQARLINVQELDLQLARLLESGRTSLIEFTTKLIHTAIFEEPPCANQDGFFNCIEILTRLNLQGEQPEGFVLDEFI